MTTPVLTIPQIIVEAGFSPSTPVGVSGLLVLDDVVNGLLDGGTLGGGTSWTDISADVKSFTVSRTMSRVQGPLWNYNGGTASIVLDNSDGNYDVDNPGSIYVDGSGN